MQSLNRALCHPDYLLAATPFLLRPVSVAVSYLLSSERGFTQMLETTQRAVRNGAKLTLQPTHRGWFADRDQFRRLHQVSLELARRAEAQRLYAVRDLLYRALLPLMDSAVKRRFNVFGVWYVLGSESDTLPDSGVLAAEFGRAQLESMLAESINPEEVAELVAAQVNEHIESLIESGMTGLDGDWHEDGEDDPETEDEDPCQESAPLPE